MHMKNLMKYSKYFLVVFFIFQKNTNAQIKIWSQVEEKSTNKINFVLLISPQNTISKVPYYTFDTSTPIEGSKLRLLQPGFNLDFSYRFGKKINPTIDLGLNVETLISTQMVSAKFCGIIAYKNNFSFCLFYNSLTLKTNHHTDARSFSKNYESTNMPGVSFEFYLKNIYVYTLYQSNKKVKFLNYKITYDFIPQVLAGGIESKSIYGSGPTFDFTFGEKLRQISISWLTPKKHEKEIYEIRNGLYLKATFPIY